MPRWTSSSPGSATRAASMRDDRHNVGWMVVDELAHRHGGSFKSKFRGRLADIRLGDLKLALLEPETYMNESGSSIQAAAAFFKLPVGQVLVVHDDVDLDTGRLQARLGGGLAGHNGLRSIAQRLGSQEFLRLRVGVGRPEPRRSAPGCRLRALGLRAGGRRRGDRRPRVRRGGDARERGARRDAASLQLTEAAAGAIPRSDALSARIRHPSVTRSSIA